MNLGILAHVDAGKTTLTEGLLHAAGVIDEIGRVDDGTTQTDSLALERQRGITIKSAVASFVVDGVTINLIDTPGHPDFIAEVERVLGVLDGAVLVVSAVEGVQSQTVLLFRALRRLGVPTIVFVNKIDRVGADDERVLAAVADRLAVDVLAMGTPLDIGTEARQLPSPRRSTTRSSRQRPPSCSPATTTRSCTATSTSWRSLPSDCGEVARRADGAVRRSLPVYFGAALTGVGVDELLHAIPKLLPPETDEPRRPGIGHGVQDRARTDGREDRVRAPVRRDAADARSRPSSAATRPRRSPPSTSSSRARRSRVRRPTPATSPRSTGSPRRAIGDTFGPITRRARSSAFAPPTLETAIVPCDADQKRAVFDALTELAEQDPLINLRQDDTRQELFLSLYGEVQKEIVAQTLQGDYGLDVEFRADDAGVHRAAEGHRRGRRADPARPVAGPSVPRHGRPGDLTAARRVRA